MAGRVKVRFTRTVRYETGGVGVGPVFEAGTVHELRPDIAQRWTRRNAAVPVEDEPAQVAAGGTPHLVGDRGPELFVPGDAVRTITPSDAEVWDAEIETAAKASGQSLSPGPRKRGRRSS